MILTRDTGGVELKLVFLYSVYSSFVKLGGPVSRSIYLFLNSDGMI